MAKTLDLNSVQYLLDLNAKLPVSAHTKQSLLFLSLLIRNIWNAGLSRASPESKIQNPVTMKKCMLKWIRFFSMFWLMVSIILFFFWTNKFSWLLTNHSVNASLLLSNFYLLFSVLPKQIVVNKLNVSPIHSPYLSSDASTDEEITAELASSIHDNSQQFLSNPTIRQLHRYVIQPYLLFVLFACFR